MKNVKPGHWKPLVIIDPGHYGKYNRSPAVREYWESEAMWSLYMLLKPALEAYGIAVKCTRSDPAKDLSLTSRGQAARGADLLISLHSNATGSGVNESVDYVIAYHLYDDNGTKVDDKSKEIAKVLATEVAKLMGTKQGGKTASRLGSGDWNGDGVMNDNYYTVLHNCRLVDTPGVILEHSFHTNTRSTKWLMDKANLQKLADAEAKIIAEYFGIVSQPEAKPSQKFCTVTLPVLRRGDKGAAVKVLQKLLIANGYSCGKYGTDGDFGNATEKALKAYQKANGLAVDGVCGNATWSKLLGV